MLRQIRRLIKHISVQRLWQLSLLLILMLMTAFAEIISIGAVLPFLSILTSPENIFKIPIIQPFIQLLNITDSKQLLLPLTIAFGVASIFAGGMRIFLLWASTRLSFAIGADLSIDIYRRTLFQPYITHCSRNSSDVINTISSKTGTVINVITMLLTLCSSAILLITIFITLLYVHPTLASLTFSGIGLIYFLIIRLTRNQLVVNSKIMARESTQVIKTLQEGLGGIRDVLIDGTQEIYIKTYQKSDLLMRKAQASSIFIGFSPRFAVEALGMLLIASLAYFLSMQQDGLDLAIPVLGALALGAQRLLPVLQQAYAAWSGIIGNQVALADTLDSLEQLLPEYTKNSNIQKLPFNNSIKLRKIDFRYNNQTPFVIKDLNIKINKGDRIGFIGVTGSGKSTLLDIIMGLLNPTNGTLLIDDRELTRLNQRSWQAHIAHVPQAIFLADCSIMENIAFGVPKWQINSQRVRLAAKQAQIANTIESWPEQYHTIVGERGVRLSGGQRQRIGIARALYKEADVIIFDEATSALDGETEEAVMQAIESIGKNHTLLIIAHRITTLRNCSQIIEIDKGTIKRIISYKEIVHLS